MATICNAFPSCPHIGVLITHGTRILKNSKSLSDTEQGCFTVTRVAKDTTFPMCGIHVNKAQLDNKTARSLKKNKNQILEGVDGGDTWFVLNPACPVSRANTSSERDYPSNIYTDPNGHALKNNVQVDTDSSGYIFRVLTNMEPDTEVIADYDISKR